MAHALDLGRPICYTFEPSHRSPCFLLSANIPVVMWYPKTYIYYDSLNKDNWFYLTGEIASDEYYISQSAIQGLHDHIDSGLFLACQLLGSKPSPKPTPIFIRNKDNSFWITVCKIGVILIGFHLTNILCTELI